jgi:hypothetical protein
MNKESIIKSLVVFGGGFLIYMLVRKSKENYKTPAVQNATSQSFVGANSSVSATPENAKIVLKAYKMAIANNEPANNLSELNKECLKEFGMRCYIEPSGKAVVCDVDGNTMLSE